jgi:DNA mismatch repair protein MutS
VSRETSAAFAAKSSSPFESLLFPGRAPETPTPEGKAPEFFRDLNLDQVVAAATAGKDEYGLKLFFYRRLDDLDAVLYRQEVMKDLEDPQLFERISSFAEKMREGRSHLRAAEEWYHRLSKNRWFLDAVVVYCDAVRQLTVELAESEPRSRGLRGFREYLSRYVEGEAFRALLSDTERVKADLDTVKYGILLRDNSVTVRHYEDEVDYSPEIEKTFQKFRQGAVKDYLIRYPEFSGMNHVEAQILERVAKLFPEIFGRFDKYCSRHRNFVDPTLQRFDREVQFYLSYLQYIGRLRRSGLSFCYPKVSRERKNVFGNEVFDLALATKLVAENGVVVANDFSLDGKERVFVVSGPNQGGKTTFARTFAQLHYLASLGCPVPGSKARLFLCDRILTHFERVENIENLRGKLHDDLVRIHRILEEATPDSLVILNEIFSSTALEDAVFLATEVMKRILDLDCLCVCVSFLDELAALGESVVSMVSAVVPENPAQRTFKLLRRPAAGSAYAIAIAEKYRLTYRSLKERLLS